MRTVQILTRETSGQTGEQQLRGDSARVNTTQAAFAFTAGFAACLQAVLKQHRPTTAHSPAGVSSDATAVIPEVPMLA